MAVDSSNDFHHDLTVACFFFNHLAGMKKTFAHIIPLGRQDFTYVMKVSALAEDPMKFRDKIPREG